MPTEAMCKVLRKNTPNIDADTPDIQKRKFVTATNFDSGARSEMITRIGVRRIDTFTEPDAKGNPQPQNKSPVQPIENSVDSKKKPTTEFRDLIKNARDDRIHLSPQICTFIFL